MTLLNQFGRYWSEIRVDVACDEEIHGPDEAHLMEIDGPETAHECGVEVLGWMGTVDLWAKTNPSPSKALRGFDSIDALLEELFLPGGVFEGHGVQKR